MTRLACTSPYRYSRACVRFAFWLLELALGPCSDKLLC